MKEITPEIKQRIFALYWGQEIMYHPDCWPVSYHELITDYNDAPIDECHLLVTPLSQITDEDATSITEIVGEWGNGNLDKDDVGEWLDEVLYNNSQTFADYVSGYQMMEIIDFLRYRGYALPYLNWTVDDLVQAGIFKLKDNPAKAQ